MTQNNDSQQPRDFRLTIEFDRELYKRLSQTQIASLEQQVIDLLRDLLQKFANQIIEDFRILEDQIEETKQQADAIAPYFREAGIWLSLSTPQFIWENLKILNRAGELTTKKLIATIIQGFHEDNFSFLNEMVSGWWDVSILERRRHIIEDALEAHKQGKYTLSVPVLLAQIEGLIHDICISPSGTTLSKSIREKLKGLMPYSYLEPVSGLAFKAVFDQMYETKLTPADDMNRHLILHGYDVDYNSALHSLRAFLFIDTLYGIYQDMNKKQP